MSTKVTVKWSIWIGACTGVYVWLYLLSPLAQYGIIWVSFIALPIYFNGGAKREEYFHYIFSYITGVGWGVLMLYVTGMFVESIGAVNATAIVVAILTAACCFHMLFPNKLFLNKVPAMFGGISATFSQGGENIGPLMITLVLGTTLGLICNEGLKLKIINSD